MITGKWGKNVQVKHEVIKRVVWKEKLHHYCHGESKVNELRWVEFEIQNFSLPSHGSNAFNKLNWGKRFRLSRECSNGSSEREGSRIRKSGLGESIDHRSSLWYNQWAKGSFFTVNLLCLIVPGGETNCCRCCCICSRSALSMLMYSTCVCRREREHTAK